jgi:hypothetical protein
MNDILAEAQTILTITPARWISLVEALPEGLLRRQPLPGEWSALECLQHLVDTEQSVFPVRIQAILAGRDFPAFDPDAPGTTTVAAGPRTLVQEFARLRAASLTILAKVAPEDLDRRARHQELGPVTLSELLNEWTAHDLMHTVQAEQALMQPFIAGSGPWQFYFDDHVARTKRT